MHVNACFDVLEVHNLIWNQMGVHGLDMKEMEMTWNDGMKWVLKYGICTEWTMFKHVAILIDSCM